jgi:hypothetical protein
MRAQLQHLVEATAITRVTLQVLPFTAGAHAGMDNEFNISGFAELPIMISTSSRTT